MSDKVYSTDNEFWGDYESAVESKLEYNNPGDEVTIYEGDSVPFKHSDFIRADSILDCIQDNAYEEIGEWQQDYLDDLTSDKDKVKAFNEVISAFISDNAKTPSCFKVVNVKEIKVTLED